MSHVRRALAVLVLAVVTAPADATDTIDCEEYGPATGLTAAWRADNYTYENDPNIDYPNIHVRWTAPAEPERYALFRGYRLERRDDTDGDTEWQEIYGPNVLRYDVSNEVFNYIGDWTEPGSACTSICAMPGHTYTYRVIVLYQHSTSGCDEYDGGRIYEVPSETVQVTVPGGPPPVEPPEDVIAVADPKRRRVSVAWGPAKGQFDRYSVRRRRVPRGPSKAGDSDVFTEIANLPPAALKFLDLSVDPESHYEYEVALLVDQAIRARSDPDAAFVPGKLCKSSNFAVWFAAWKLLDAPGGVLHCMYDQKKPILHLVNSACTSHCSNLHGDRARFGAAPRLSARTQGLFRGASVGELDLGTATLPLQTRCRLVAELTSEDPFSTDSYTRGTVRFESEKKVFLAESRIELDETAPSLWKPRTGVCAVTAVASDIREFVKQGGEVPVGYKVAFAVQIVATGPAPLYAQHLRLVLDVEGGEIDTLHPEDFVRLAEGVPLSPTRAEFEIGALGPAGPATSQVAQLAVVAVAPTYPSGGQLRVKATFVKDPRGTRQDVFPPEPMFAEVKLQKPVPAKSR